MGKIEQEMNIALKVESLCCFYGKTQVLWGISFRVRAGSITTILGSNGAGKSTIVRSVAGLHAVGRGQVIYEEEIINDLDPFERVELGISLVPEERRLFPNLTLDDNLRLGAYIKRARMQAEERLGEIYQRFPFLSRRRRQLAGTLSGGEQQMAAIGRGLMSKPKLLMLDEPSLGLAPLLAKEVFELTREINREGVTVLLIEQNVHQSMRIADEVFVLESGHVVAQGSSEEISKEERIRSAYLGI